MRLIAGISLIDRGIMRLWTDPPILVNVLSVLTICGGLLLVVGLWTPVVGTLVAVIEVWKIFLLPENLWIYILLATLRCSPGTTRTRSLFGRTPFWMEAHRHSRRKKLVPTTKRVISGLERVAGVSQESPRAVPI
jgi:hypothetical protein